MIKLQMTIASLTLYRPIKVNIVLPYGHLAGNPPYKALWLLHPAMEDENFFLDKLSMLGEADRQDIALISPGLGNGYFLNSCIEQQSDFLSNELLPCIQANFPISSSPQDNFLIGISMGAFGATLWGVKTPDAFSAIAAISGVYDPRLPLDERALKDRTIRPFIKILGEKVMNRLMLDAHGQLRPEADIESLLARNAPNRPRFNFMCGDRDYLSLAQTENMAAVCQRYGLDVSTEFSPGLHNLDYWFRAVKNAINWISNFER